MRKANVKKITLEDLARMVANGFRGVDERFDRVETRLGHVETKLDGVETRLNSVEENVLSLKQDLLNINDRFVPWNAFDRLAHRLDMLGDK